MSPRKPAPNLNGPRTRAERLVESWLSETGQEVPRRAVNKLVARVSDVYAGQMLRSPRKKGRKKDLLGCPVPVATSHASDKDLRCPDCTAYGACMDYALAQRWKNWSCRGCRGPGHKSNDHYVKDQIQLHPDGTPYA
jgi:hypothetical protein